MPSRVRASPHPAADSAIDNEQAAAVDISGVAAADGESPGARPAAPVAAFETTASTATEAEVRELYQLLLDREPEGGAPVAARTSKPIDALITEFLLSQEFCEKNREYLMLLFA